MNHEGAGTGSVSLILSQFREQSESAATTLWRRYFPRLVRVARTTLNHLPHRSDDAEDAAQSAFMAFWQQIARSGLESVVDRNSLWKLLATITIRKAQQKLRRERAQKRGGGKVTPVSQLIDSDGQPLRASRLFHQVPAHEFDLMCDELLELLPDDLRSFAVLRLFGHTNQEISEYARCSERKVERKLNLIRSYWREQSDGS
ncbi:MAG: ECF-type sigma factor [Planctomycetaceae bacterium]